AGTGFSVQEIMARIGHFFRRRVAKLSRKGGAGMEKRDVVRLTDDQRAALEERFAGPLTLRQRNRIQVLLRADRGETDGEIAEGLGIPAGRVFNPRRRFAAGGLGASLAGRPRRGVPAKLDGKAEAVVVALACSKAPEGRARWTAKMLADRLV